MASNNNSMKRIVLVATGGTIAGKSASADDVTGYRAASLSADELLGAVPGIDALARITVESPFSIDSKDITPEHWLILARRVDTLLADPTVDAVVITHGTDTLEESAYFLHLTLPGGKPVVMTGAMRPATALSADGPMNLYQAINLAASGITAGLGVVVAMNGEIHGARSVVKTHTLALSALTSPNGGPLGRCDPPALLQRPAAEDAGRYPLSGLKRTDPLPAVGLITVASGMTPDFLQVLAPLCDGIVLALPGHGSLPASWEKPCADLLAQGKPVVRSSRTGAGPVLDLADSTLLSSRDLHPGKARITLILALASDIPFAEHFAIGQ